VLTGTELRRHHLRKEDAFNGPLVLANLFAGVNGEIFEKFLGSEPVRTPCKRKLSLFGNFGKKYVSDH
jgi:hypothetical protein